MRPKRLLEICRKRGIDRIALTDHNTIAGALEAASLDPTRVIVGEEIMTRHGELLAYFVRERIPPDLPPEEAIARLRSQGALISVSHPFDPWRSGAWRDRDLHAILPLIDAVEVFNARSWPASADMRAAALAGQTGVLRTAGSDAHAYLEVGRAGLRLPPFEDAQGMRLALTGAQLFGRRSSPMVHWLSRYASWRKALSRSG